MCIYVYTVPCIIAELSFRKKLCRYLEIKAERHDSARAIEKKFNTQSPDNIIITMLHHG